MDCNDKISPILEPIEHFNSCLTCKVCGSENAQSHYGALCCISCKIFFRRNFQYDLNSNQCVFDGQCDITINSRRACRYCRMKKCLLIGMQRELLRATYRHNIRNKKLINDKQIICLPSYIHSINLLKNDQSLLTKEQWSYLSNIINTYNIKSPLFDMRHLLDIQSTYPMKIRLKMATSTMLNILSLMYQNILPFIEKISQFNNLMLDDRTALLERNLKNAGGYSGIISFREADIYDTVTFKNGFPSIYGLTITNEALQIYQRADINGTIIKLLIPILIFSTGSDVLISINKKNTKYGLLSNTKSILDIQNFYVEILFKYMIYQFGYEESILRFAAMIKSSLDQIMCALHAEEIQRHEQLMQTIAKQTEQSLILRDDIIID